MVNNSFVIIIITKEALSSLSYSFPLASPPLSTRPDHEATSRWGRGKSSMSKMEKTTKKPALPASLKTILPPPLNLTPDVCLALTFVFALTVHGRLGYPSSSSDCNYCSRRLYCSHSWKTSRVDSKLLHLLCHHTAAFIPQRPSCANG